ncbi:MAG: asparagine synthase C-terminal domain-containing protein, partial [Bacteroidota bacterium]
EKHLMSDVPVGLFLSGGYDSTAIAYYLEQLHYNSQAFSVGFPGWKGSEHQFARIVAEKFSHKHNELMATEEDYGLLEKLMFHYDDPIADISIIPTFLVSRFASEKVKTVLSGEGADEIFGGYSWYKTGVRQPYKQSVYDSGQRMLKGIRPFSTEHYAEAMAMGMFGKKTLREMLGTDIRIPEDPFHFYRKTEPEGITGVKAFQFRDIRSFMGELVLTKVDRASMANSLEVRVPFLDHRIAEFVLRLDENIYHKKNITKFLLHENIKDKVPAEILKRPKQGFTGPDSFYGNFNLYREILNDSVLVSDQYIQKEFVISALQRKDKWRLWKLAVMETWYRKWK